jgi:hypothetical protein
MRKILLIIFVCVCQVVVGQKYDYHWILGEQGLPSETGNMDVLFTDTSADTVRNQRFVPMDNSQTTVCDSSGNLIFFSNGARIYNATNATMQNGDSLNFGAA